VASEHQAIERWVYSTLSGDATLLSLVANMPNGTDPAIYAGRLAPSQTEYPAVAFDIPQMDDINAQGHRHQCHAMLMVYSFSNGEIPPYGVANRIEQLLHQAKAVSEGYTLVCERVGENVRTNVDGSRIFRHLVTEYRVMLAVPQS
jgi:hypothetical protein